MTVAYSPQQNGVSERKNRTLLDRARSMAIENGIPTFLWAETLATANYLVNRSPTRANLGLTPEEKFTGKPPDLAHLKSFGCIVYVHQGEHLLNKLEARARKGIFLGYDLALAGYRCYIPELKKVVITRDVRFCEQVTPKGLQVPTSQDSATISEVYDLPEEVTDLPQLDSTSVAITPTLAPTLIAPGSPPRPVDAATPTSPARQYNRHLFQRHRILLPSRPSSLQQLREYTKQGKILVSINLDLLSRMKMPQRAQSLEQHQQNLPQSFPEGPHGGIFMSQRDFIKRLLEEEGMLECKAAATPMEEGLQLLSDTNEPEVDNFRYRRVVGKLLYVTHSRPDIAYAVGLVSRFVSRPTESHLDAVKRILRYLQGTMTHGILFRKRSTNQIHGYADADWGSDSKTRRSTTGERRGITLSCIPRLVSTISNILAHVPVDENRPLTEFQQELVLLASQLNGDHVLRDYPSLGKKMTVKQGNDYVNDAVARFIREGEKQLRAGVNETTILQLKSVRQVSEESPLTGRRERFSRSSLRQSS
ncbi:hypothetical protein R1sor_004275 [Riccia sorocarpa]|uniref:Integrase catalytic domain-containing protein n=1 Tax=Riccia sorocarpa TaxID=122646 RepID=A0ABD3H418_9MARC